MNEPSVVRGSGGSDGGKGDWLVRLEGVRVSLGGRLILGPLDWTLRAGERWFLHGPNGSGKSTFLRLVRGETWPDPIGGGARWYRFGPLPSPSPLEARPVVALVGPQQRDHYLRGEIPLTGSELILSGLTDTVYPPGGVVRATWRQQVADVIAGLGLEELTNKPLLRMSQGELGKVFIARALVSRPRVLLLDECGDGLDAAARARFLEAFGRYVGQSGSAVVLATHRRSEVPGWVRHAARLDVGRLVPEDLGAESTEWQPGGAAAPARGGEDSRSAARPARRGRSDDPRPAGAGARAVPSKPTPVLLPAPAMVVRVRGANVYRDRQLILRGVDWVIRAGEHWVVEGPNGSGKSTLLRVVAGELPVARGGEVIYGEEEPAAAGIDVAAPPRSGPAGTYWHRRQRVALFSFTQAAEWSDDVTADRVVAGGLCDSYRDVPDCTRRHQDLIRTVAARLGASTLLDRSVLGLSYGEKKKVFLARALVRRPRLLLLDEPFDGLDPGAKHALQEDLSTLTGAGTQLVLVSHHAQDVPAWVNRTLRLAGGRVVASAEASGDEGGR